MQFNNKVEELQDWTSNRDAIMQVLDTKLISGKRARFYDAVIAAAGHLETDLRAIGMW